MNEKKKVLYVQTSGVDTPERTYASFILATTAVAMGIDETIYFLMRGCTLIKYGEAEKIKLGGMPCLREATSKPAKSRMNLKICEQSCALLGPERGDLREEAKIAGAATFNDQVLDADAILCF